MYYIQDCIPCVSVCVYTVKMSPGLMDITVRYCDTQYHDIIEWTCAVVLVVLKAIKSSRRKIVSPPRRHIQIRNERSERLNPKPRSDYSMTSEIFLIPQFSSIAVIRTGVCMYNYPSSEASILEAWGKSSGQNTLTLSIRHCGYGRFSVFVQPNWRRICHRHG